MKKDETHLNKNTVSLRIKKEFLMQIVSGQKKEEYREINEFNISRLCILSKDFAAIDVKKYDFVNFYVGNKKDAEYAILICKGIFVDTFKNEIEGAPPVGTQCFTIELGEVVETNVKL